MRKFLIFIIAIILLIAAGGYFLFYTTEGIKYAIGLIPKLKPQWGQVQYTSVSGSLHSGLIFNDLRVFGVAKFPDGSFLSIKQLALKSSSLSVDALNANIEQGRLQIPEMDPILISGRIQNGVLNVNIFTPGIDLATASKKFPFWPETKVSGKIEQADVYLTERINRPRIKGDLKSPKLTFGRFTMEHISTAVNLIVGWRKRPITIDGEVYILKGVIYGNRTAKIELLPSQVFFHGKPKDPQLRIRGNAKVEQTVIRVSLSGKRSDPKFRLTSEPMLPQQRLLLMLATNQSWEKTEQAFSSGQISPDVAKDFLNYFLFNGSDLGRKFGIKNVIIHYGENGTGIGFTKEVSDKLNATYDVKTKTLPEGTKEVEQTIGGQYNLTDKILIDAQRQMQFQTLEGSQTPPVPPKTSDEILLKFRTKF